MIRSLSLAALLLLFMNTSYAQGGCTTLLESLEAASATELCGEHKRLRSYKNPYCDTTNSIFHDIMKQIGIKAAKEGLTKEVVLSNMGEPYYHGPLADYEKQKVSVGRNGTRTGKALPPAYKIPTGEYYIVYFWRETDYLVFALKGGVVVETRWWEKGNFR
ncbi:MAG: hypothetical protein HN542_06150 [Flavobacteriales bacterium]|jgi:hypothetical protein|nr:hypothetical protein [Flavobacteriales bacterium]MBT4703951.1 hypothetical protein [Flavobacteriales bacterium]MBT5132576.1 hypothetical protein [Flavobacteriales bacterium]MBT5976139.1 hypothetical protein [Flavobacteriales bacterium]MBT6133243.1 hypothetical protein [Flavobacteriales bacterium]